MMNIVFRALIVLVVTFVGRKVLEMVFDMLKSNRAQQNNYRYTIQNPDDLPHNGQLGSGENTGNSGEAGSTGDNSVENAGETGENE